MIMKKIYLLFVFIIFLSSCKKNIEKSYNIIENNYIYVFNEDNIIKKIEIDYIIKNEIDVFNIYTSHQNYIPIKYHSPAHPNLILLNYTVNNNIINYYVNEFILESDINNLYNVFKLSLNEYGYDEIYFFYNNNLII